MTTETAQRLRQLLPMLGSDHDGEIVATAKAIERVLRSAGADWHDVENILLADALTQAQARRRP